LKTIEYALASIGSLEQFSLQESFIHRIDPRAKVIVTAVFAAITVSLSKYNISGILPFFLYPVFLMSAGGIPLSGIAYKILAVSPFALAIGIINPFFDTQTIMIIAGVNMSGGIVLFVSIVLKFILTVSAALLLVAVTGFESLCAGLVRMKVPRVFAIQLLFMYRYIFVLFSETLRMLRAHSLRSSRNHPGIKIAGSFSGQLLIRSMDRAERIHRAMLARGFDGQIRLRKTIRMTINDSIFIIAWCAYFILCRIYNLSEIAGSAIEGVLR